MHIAKQDMARNGTMQSRITATMLSLAESERELISQRTRAALARPGVGTSYS
jgi:DNA invertase Pin-like site-specific DNA recombinase